MRWLTHNWYELLTPPTASVLLVFAALVCGGIVGTEYQRRQKSVGVRTLTLVSFGSAVFTMVTGALSYRVPIAAQIVSGIGFLGAGVILRGPYGITGLNSAATIWAVAAVGMVVGIGYAGAGVALSLLLLASMAALSLVERHFDRTCPASWAVLTFRRNGGKTFIKIQEAINEYGFPKASQGPVISLPVTGQPADDRRDARQQLRVRYCDHRRGHREFLAYLASLDEIEEIDCQSPDAPVD